MRTILVMVFVVLLAGCGGKNHQQPQSAFPGSVFCSAINQTRAEGLSDYQIFRRMDDNGDFDKWVSVDRWKKFKELIAPCH